MTPGPDPKFDRQEVLDSAMELFWAQGYEATGMTQLLEHVGIGRQSFYNAFGDKRSLFLEALANYEQCTLHQVEALLARDGSPLGNIRAVWKMWEEMARDTDFQGCLFANAAAEFGRGDAVIAKAVDAAFQRGEKAFRDALDRAVEAGELVEGTKTRDLARALVCAAQGLARLGRVKEDKVAFTRSVVRSLEAMRPVVR